MSFNPNSPLSAASSSKKHKVIIISVLSALLLALIGWGVYVWIQNNELADAQTKVVLVDDQAVTGETDQSDALSTVLPNGLTATYDNTASNRNIIFSASDKGMTYVALSHKSVEAYIPTVEESITSKLCGPNGERAVKENIVLAAMSTEKRMVEYSTEDNCLTELATMRNSDTASRREAVELIKQAEADIRQFYATVIIK